MGLAMDAEHLIAELPRLRRYARALVGDRAQADDLVQDTLERAWSRAAQWRGDAAGTNLHGWLLSIMHNLRMDQLRRAAPAAMPLDDAALDVPARATQTDGLEVRDLDRALQLLPEDQRTVLLLVSLDDQPYAEVARLLDVPVGTVMSRLSRARTRLHALLNPAAPTKPHLKVIA